MSTTVDEELLFDGPAALAARVRAREIRPRELVELSLRRIDAVAPRLNAFRVTLGEEALAAADAAEAGELGGALAGVPVAIKDDMPVRGQSDTHGTRSVRAPNEADAEIIRRLRAAGAIPIGITNVPELTIWPWTATDANGITRNPWDLSRTPGGSSGGSAAAVAAGLVACATGSDGGGSIRIPAACCGLVGMKPTRGLVTMDPHGEHWLGLTSLGGLARTVRDSALMLEVLADAQGLVAATERPPERLRVAVSRKMPAGVLSRLSDDQRVAWQNTAELLTELGHDVRERSPDYGFAQLEFVQAWVRGIYEESTEFPDPAALELLTRRVAAAGRVLVPPARRERLLARRERTIARIQALWNDVDILLTPALATTAIAAEGGYGKPAPRAFDIAARFTPYTPIWNLTGQPAVTLPAGFGADGLPVSVQLVGRPGEEALLYRLAAQIEQARPWSHHRPAAV